MKVPTARLPSAGSRAVQSPSESWLPAGSSGVPQRTWPAEFGDGEAAQRRGTDDDLGEIGAAGRGEVPDDRGGGGSDKDCLGIADGLLDLDRGGVAAPQGRGGDLGLPPALDGEDQVEECDGRGQHRDGNEGQKPLP